LADGLLNEQDGAFIVLDPLFHQDELPGKLVKAFASSTINPSGLLSMTSKIRAY
jgi:hypothetical protein